MWVLFTGPELQRVAGQPEFRAGHWRGKRHLDNGTVSCAHSRWISPSHRTNSTLPVVLPVIENGVLRVLNTEFMNLCSFVFEFAGRSNNTISNTHPPRAAPPASPLRCLAIICKCLRKLRNAVADENNCAKQRNIRRQDVALIPNGATAQQRPQWGLKECRVMR